MADYISREAAIEALCKAHSPYPRRREISVRAIQELPAADVRPVVRGKWEYINNRCDGYAWQICSECGEKGKSTWNFCRNCGAVMTEVQDGN